MRTVGEEDLDHPTAVRVLTNLGDVLARSGAFAEAEVRLREALERRLRILPEGHPDLAVTLNQLGHVLRQRGEVEAAREMYAEALEANRAKLGDWHVEVGNGELNLAVLWIGAEDPAQAEAHARQALDVYTASLPADHWKVAGARCVLGEALTRQGRFEEAEGLLVGAREQLANARGACDAQTVRAMSALLRLYLASGRASQAALTRELLVACQGSENGAR